MSKKPSDKARDIVERGRQLFAESRSQLRTTLEHLRQTKAELDITSTGPAAAQTAPNTGESPRSTPTAIPVEIDETEPPPVATPTIARLYLRQGKLEHAARMFEELAANRPSDLKLATELAQVRQAVAQAKTKAAATTEELRVSARGRELHCTWKISAEGAQRGEWALGAPGNLVLRVAGFPANPTALPKDIPLTANFGAAKISAPAGASLVTASVGLRGGDERFASIVHCAFVRLTEPPA